MIEPHGGQLIRRLMPAAEQAKLLRQLNRYPRIRLDIDQVREVKNIGHGAYSPLRGFLRSADCARVCEEMRLSDGTVWPVPIVLDISAAEAHTLEGSDRVILEDPAGAPVAVLDEPEVYSYSKESMARSVFGTTDPDHPGAARAAAMQEYFLGGEITLLTEEYSIFSEYARPPAEIRRIFSERGWQSAVAFQTRNIPHRGHEFLQKEALKEADGLLVHPVVGRKKVGDFKDEYILASYQLLIETHYPAERVVLGALSIPMRYAGPREAVLHALIRKNFGCSHFIVGRDHAGVGSYYEPFAAQEIFDTFAPGEVGVEILKYPEVVYDEASQEHRFHDPARSGRSFSGTEMRQSIQKRQAPPEYVLRPEVHSFLIQSDSVFVDPMYHQSTDQAGFVLWFTGLSQSGKSTNAEAVLAELKERGVRVEYLDGDVVREHLSPDLGFSKADRDENIRRIAFVAKLLSQNQTGVVCAFISPYRSQRELLREQTENFIEVFCDCPLEDCEARDTKGLYKKARSGQIQNFTGVSDPYEPPEQPELTLNTRDHSPAENAEKILSYLDQRKLI